MLRVRILFVVLGLAVFQPALARDYQVEILVFERSGAGGNIQEQWNPQSNQARIFRQQLNRIAGKADDLVTQPGASRLKNIEDKLRQSGYRILQSLRWQQPAATFPGAPVVNVSNVDNPLQGYVRIYKTSLIFSDLSLALTGSGGSAANPVYFINEKRRLKFKEVHYFDHPKLGAILTVWPAGE